MNSSENEFLYANLHIIDKDVQMKHASTGSIKRVKSLCYGLFHTQFRVWVTFIVVKTTKVTVI